MQHFQSKILKIVTEKRPPHFTKGTFTIPSSFPQDWLGFRDPGDLKYIERFLVWVKPHSHLVWGKPHSHQWLWNTEDVNCVKRTKGLFGVCLSAPILHHKHLPLLTGWRWEAVDRPLNKHSCTQSLTAPLLILFHFKWNHKDYTLLFPALPFSKKVKECVLHMLQEVSVRRQGKVQGASKESFRCIWGALSLTQVANPVSGEHQIFS